MGAVSFIFLSHFGNGGSAGGALASKIGVCAKIPRTITGVCCSLSKLIS